MRIYLKRLAITLAFTPVVLLIALVLINLRDQPLDPAVARVLDAPVPEPTESGRRAYLYLLGLAAGERVDPERRGGEIWSATRQRAVRDALDAHVWSRAPKVDCANDACGVIDLTPANVAVMNETVVLTNLYAGLMDFEDLAFLKPSLRVPDARAHRLFGLRLAQWFDRGGEVRAFHALASSNRFYAAVLRRGPLSDRHVALIAMVANARVLRKESARRPGLIIPPEVTASFSPVDVGDLLGEALSAEVRVLKESIDDLAHGPGTLGLRPHETINRAFEILNQMSFTDCARADHGCVPALAYVDWRPPWHWLLNPVGRYFVGEVTRGVIDRARLEALTAEVLDYKARARRRP